MSQPVKPKVNPDLIVAPIDGGLIIYNPRDAELHHLNPQASVAFQCFDGTGTLSEVATDIADAFGLDASEVEGQVRSIYTRFRREGLIEGAERYEPEIKPITPEKAAAMVAAADVALADLEDEEDDDDEDDEPG